VPTCRCAAVALTLCLACAGACADDWPGWRGVEREGRSVSPDGPTEWSATRNVSWRTDIPGQGFSSPIVVGDGVYLTTAFEVQPFGRTGFLLRSGLVAVAAIFAALAAHVVARRASAAGAAPASASPLPLIALASLAAAICLVILFAEGILDFERGHERGWLAAVMVTVCALLLLTVLARGNARRLVACGLAMIAAAVVLLLTMPDLAHIFSDGPISAKVGFLCVVTWPPVIVGLLLIGAGLRGRVAGSAASGLALTLAIVLVGGFTVLMIAEHAKTRTTLSVGEAHEPLVTWWMALAAAAALAISWALLRRWPASAAATLAVMVTGTLTVLAAPLAAVELLISRSHYLAYQLGRPEIAPMLGWRAVATVGGVALLAAAVTLALRRVCRPSLRGVQGALAVVALMVAGAYFAYARYVPKSPWMARSVVCVDRASGEIRWRNTELEGPVGIIHSDNSPATPTPVSDGECVCAWFGSAGLVCVEPDGRTRWTRADLPFESRHGVGTSPILCGPHVIILSESEAGRYLAAVDRSSGEIAWRVEREQPTHQYAGNCRTPAVLHIGGRETIVVWGYTDLSGYDPASGRELWTLEVGKFGHNNNPVSSLVNDDERIYLVGPRATMALARDQLAFGPKGESARDPVLWETPTDDGAQCASPVLVNTLLFAVSDVGTVYCLDAATGETLWTDGLGMQHYASAIAIGDRVYFTDTSGTTVVYAAEPRCRTLARSTLDELIYASMAPVDGRLYLRTEDALYCLDDR